MIEGDSDNMTEMRANRHVRFSQQRWTMSEKDKDQSKKTLRLSAFQQELSEVAQSAGCPCKKVKTFRQCRKTTFAKTTGRHETLLRQQAATKFHEDWELTEWLQRCPIPRVRLCSCCPWKKRTLFSPKFIGTFLEFRSVDQIWVEIQ